MEHQDRRQERSHAVEGLKRAPARVGSVSFLSPLGGRCLRLCLEAGDLAARWARRSGERRLGLLRKCRGGPGTPENAPAGDARPKIARSAGPEGAVSNQDLPPTPAR